MMIDRDEDKLFQDLLSDYSAPVEDDGFAAALLARLERPRGTAQMRRTWMWCASFVGGAIAAVQIGPLWSMVKTAVGGIRTPELNLNPVTADVSAISPYTWAGGGMAFIIVLMCLAYSLMDSDPV